MSERKRFHFDLRSSFSLLIVFTNMWNLIGLAAHQNRCNSGANFSAFDLLELALWYFYFFVPFMRWLETAW